MNFSIKIDGVIAEMVDNASLKYVIISPAFSLNAITGDFSYTIAFPNTSQNMKIFKFVEMNDIYIEDTKRNCELYLDNNLFVGATFQITKSTKQFVSGNIINSAYDFIKKITSKTLSEITLYEQTFSSSSDKIAWMKDTVNYNYPDRPGVMFPVYNEVDNSKNTSSSIGYGKHINQMTLDGAGNLQFIDPGPLTYNFFLLFPYVAYIIEQIFKTFGIILLNNVFEQDNELKKLVLLNFIRNGWNIASLDLHPENFHLRDFIADNNILEFLNGLKKLFGFGFFFNFLRNEVESVLFRDLLADANYVDWTDKVIISAEKDYNQDDQGYFFRQDSNDDTFQNKQSDYDIGNNFIIDYHVNKADDLTQTATQGQIALVDADNAYYHFDKLNDTDTTLQWIFLSWNFFGVKTKEASKNVDTKTTTIGMFWNDRTSESLDLTKTSQTNIWMIPEVGLKVIDNWNTLKLSKNNPRIAFYRGIRQGMDAYGFYTVNYPLGTSGRTDAQGNVIGDLEIQYDGDYGLKKTYLKEWIDLMDDPIIYNFKFNLNVRDLLNLDLKTKVKINSNFYLIKKIEIDLPLKSPVKVEMVRI